MQYSDIIQNVKSAANIDSDETAQKAIEATFRTLKERIIGDEASNLAAQLPEEVAQHLRGREGKNGDHFPIEEFYERVAKLENTDPSTAAMHVRGVFTVLNSAVSAGEMNNIRNDLSDDYQELLPVAAAK